MAKKATIKEIAKIAQVSPATVSLVINNKPGVSEQTRERIISILESTRYISSRTTSRKPLSFAFLKYTEHGMVVEENQGFIPAIIEYIEYSCAQKKIPLFTKISDKYSFETILFSQEILNVDGLFVLGTELNTSQIALLQKLKQPYLVIDNECRAYQMNSVVMNNHGIVRQAVEHLYSLGHRRIGYLCSNVEISNFLERRNGFYDSIRELGMQMCSRLLLTPTLRGAYTDAKEQLKNEEDLPSAFFADNDTIAIGAIKAFQELGHKIPEDISIIGVDDIPYSSITSPALTTVKVSRRAMAEFSVSALIQCVEAYLNNAPFPAIKTFVEGQLIIRDSTKPLT